MMVRLQTIKLAGSIANAKLANPSITLNGSALALGVLLQVNI